jgi:hypothetical protein
MPKRQPAALVAAGVEAFTGVEAFKCYGQLAQTFERTAHALSNSDLD